LEIQGFIIIFVIAFGKMHYQNCSLLQKIKQNYLSADKVISDFLQKKPKISLTELRRLIIKVLQDKVLYATERTTILHGSDRNSAVIVRLLCGNSAVRAGIYEQRITRIEQIIKKE
jgi:hypothetical protein